MGNRRFELVHSPGFGLVLVVRTSTKRGSVKHSDWKNSDWKHRGTESKEVGGGGSKYLGTGAPILGFGWLVRVCRWAELRIEN